MLASELAEQAAIEVNATPFERQHPVATVVGYHDRKQAIESEGRSLVVTIGVADGFSWVRMNLGDQSQLAVRNCRGRTTVMTTAALGVAKPNQETVVSRRRNPRSRRSVSLMTALDNTIRGILLVVFMRSCVPSIEPAGQGESG